MGEGGTGGTGAGGDGSGSSGRLTRSASAALVVLLGVPVVGVILGGLYAVPAMWLTRSKDPHLTILLCCCLVAPVGVVGCAFGTPRSWMLVHWLTMVVALLVRRMSGPLGGNVERFGIVNAFALLVGVAAGLAWRAGVGHAAV